MNQQSIAAVFLVFFSLPLMAQESIELEPGYYVVVAAYASSKEALAKAYQEKLNAGGHDARYGFNSSRDLYFVYLAQFSSLKEGVNSMLATREQGVFRDAWVRVVPGDIRRGQDSPPVASDPPPSPSARPAQQAEQPSSLLPGPADDEKDSTAETKEPAVVPPDEEIVQYDPISLQNTEVFLSVFNAANNRIIDAEVEVVDAERARSIGRVRANEYLMLPDPKNSTGKLTLIANVFGYRPVQHAFNYRTPLADTTQSYIQLMGTNFVVDFDMVRYRKGDVAILYQVYFYNDAAVMMPESQYELNSLVQLMTENPKYRIRLHGHTNGNYRGKIIARGPDQDFFTLGKDNRSLVGSARQLSELRAAVIRDYLISHGVDGSRIEMRAWGGKKPLYDKTGPNAKKNVRVEVEVLED